MFREGVRSGSKAGPKLGVLLLAAVTGAWALGCSQGTNTASTASAASSGAAEALYSSLRNVTGNPQMMRGVDQVASGLYNAKFSQLTKTFDPSAMQSAALAAEVDKLDHLLPNVGAYVSLGDNSLDPLSKEAVANFAKLAGSASEQAAATAPARAAALATYVYLTAIETLGHPKNLGTSLALIGEGEDALESVNSVADAPEDGDIDGLDFFGPNGQKIDFKVEPDGSMDVGNVTFTSPGSRMTAAASANSIADAAAESHLSMGQYLSAFIKNNGGKIGVAVATGAAGSAASATVGWEVTHYLNGRYKATCTSNCDAGSTGT